MAEQRSPAGVVACGVLFLAVCGCSGEPPNVATGPDAAEIHFAREGSGDPAILFVHGWANDRTVWDEQVDHFANRYQVVAVDLPGFGESTASRSDWSMRMFGEDVVTVIRALELERVVLVGFSMGSAVVIEAANRIPERVAGVVIVDHLHDVEARYPPEMLDAIESTMMDLVRNPAPDKFGSFIRHDVEESYDRVLAMIEGGPRPGWRESLREAIRWTNEDSRDALERLTVPVVAINSDQEPTDVEAFRRYVPSFQARIIPNVGHVVMWDATEAFNRLLEETIHAFSSEQ